MTVADALADLKVAVLDLQSADFDTYGRPLKKLAKALSDPSLKAINDDLKSGLDFEKFLADGGARGRSGYGSLDWPLDKKAELGLALILIERGAADENWFLQFAHRYYDAGSKHIAAIRKTVSSVIIPFARDYRAYVEAQAMVAVPKARRVAATSANKVFLVHGHDEGPKHEVARFLEAQGLEPVILHERSSRGMTIIEKLEAHSDVGFAIVLFTPDDMGRAKDEPDEKPRARQNVVLELGYFIAHLGRGRVCAIRKGFVEWPTDYGGVVYVEFDPRGGWKVELARELKDAGYEIDFEMVVMGRSKRVAATQG
jgi:predicted nucleotide-binding protein